MEPSASPGPGYFPIAHGGVASATDDLHRGIDLRAWYYCGLAFFLGLIHPWTVSLVGQMPVGEFLTLGLLGQVVLWCALTSRLPSVVSPRLLLVFGITQVIALLSYVLSDLYRDSLPVDMVRGWMRMFFLAVDILAYAILFGSDARGFAWHQLGFAFSFVQALVIRPIFGDYWKFGFGFPLTVLLVLVGPYFFGRLGGIGALIVISAAHAVMAFRSAAAACWLVAGLLALRYLPLRLRQGLVIGGVIAVTLASPMLVSNTFTSESGRSNRSNIERGAMLRAAWEGFASDPLIGQGSWFSKSHVMDNFLLIRKQVCDESNNGGGFDHNDFEGVTIHSQILVALAEGGIFGATFFIFYSVSILWAIYYTLGEGEWTWLLPSRLFVLVTSFWDVLMTPFSGVLRLNIAFTAAIVLLCWSEKQSAARRAVEEAA